MAVNPQLLPYGMLVPFVNEILVLRRDGVEFDVDKIPGSQWMMHQGERNRLPVEYTDGFRHKQARRELLRL